MWEVRCWHCWPPERKTEVDVGHEITSCLVSEFSCVYIGDSGSPNTIGTAHSVFVRWRQALKCVLFVPLSLPPRWAPSVRSSPHGAAACWDTGEEQKNKFFSKNYKCLFETWGCEIWNKEMLMKDIIGKVWNNIKWKWQSWKNNIQQRQSETNQLFMNTLDILWWV